MEHHFLRLMRRFTQFILVLIKWEYLLSWQRFRNCFSIWRPVLFSFWSIIFSEGVVSAGTYVFFWTPLMSFHADFSFVGLWFFLFHSFILWLWRILLWFLYSCVNCVWRWRLWCFFLFSFFHEYCRVFCFVCLRAFSLFWSHFLFDFFIYFRFVESGI